MALFDGQGKRIEAKRALAQLKDADPKLGELIEAVGAFKLEVEGIDSPFLSLAESIAYQQLTGKAAATIFGRVRALHPGRRFTPKNLLATPDTALRACGLSNAKTLALKDLAEKAAAGVVPPLAKLQTMPEEEIIERLTSIRGIGRWTVEMLLMFRLGRPDVLPVTDYGIRKGFQKTFRTRALPTPAQIALRGERWRPYRTIASWYLWRSLEFGVAKKVSGGRA